jgi:hypothetical protein
MQETWASGALELLKHADSHISLDTAFDSRIAFISIDNSVETSIRTFISLPHKKSGIKFPSKEINEAGNSFPKMVDLLFKYASSKIIGLDDSDIEHYHRIRNQLYHNGTGLGVDERYLHAYRQIAAVLLNNLFDVDVPLQTQSEKPTLVDLILLFNEVESQIKRKLQKGGVDTGHTFKWEIAEKEGIISIDDVKKLTELRMIRNTQVHSKAEDIDLKRISLGITLAEQLLKKLKG